MNDPKKIMIDVTKYKMKHDMPSRKAFMTFYWYCQGNVYEEKVGETMINFICNSDLKITKSEQVQKDLCQCAGIAYKRFLVENNLLGEVIFDHVGFDRACTAWTENEGCLYKEYLRDIYRQLCPDIPFSVFAEYIVLKTKGKKIYSIHKTLFSTEEFKWIQRVYNIGLYAGKANK